MGISKGNPTHIGSPTYPGPYQLQDYEFLIDACREAEAMAADELLQYLDLRPLSPLDE